ncbi:hypothetical protein SAMD00019534_033420 [Acytostelium subglobosum LB1]|uniref:hypothetical protein n=1 Tax=Acytostelium subglobosum LB1 TaxID=1410327 RepID=UPI000644DEA7|nr:hypothetical protein SAMD00019534_033420 [Acytostelium subglobosum LB1]GAM20167.1 hypothetical protein SAMD00019534_033420 [Acytostelium subglobosum LB1]|eukprot:XP_012759688.1 hypothetical protein SAMD00019534_033420 [Acytostelium subglobosum LB1]
MIITSSDGESVYNMVLRAYQLNNQLGQHHVCDKSLINFICTSRFGPRCSIVSELRFKDSSWPLYVHGTKIPFVSLMFGAKLEDLAVMMLKVPGLPPVDKMVIELNQWFVWSNEMPLFKKKSETWFKTITELPCDRVSLLDIFMITGELDLIKHLLTTYGLKWITRYSEKLIERRSPEDQKMIRSYVSDLEMFVGRGGGGKASSKSTSKKKKKSAKTKQKSQSQSPPLVDHTQPLDSNNIESMSISDVHVQSQNPPPATTASAPPPSQLQQSPAIPEPLSLEKYESTVGKFKFSRKMIIGRGSNGTLVYKGVWCDKVPVAIKQMNKGFNTLIDKEVNILIQLTALSSATDNLVRFFGMEEDDHFVYLATSLCEMSLQELVESHKDRFQSLNKQTLINDIINGVRFLHNDKFIHNDLNPRNILFKDNHLFITDMGLSKMSVETSFAFTHAPSGQGGYFPAEVINNQRKTNSVDIFSLGCLMYYILTDGGHPFGDNLPLRVSKIIFDQFDIQQLTDQPCATDLITQMISHDPSTRPSITSVINHPFFWDINKRQSFIIRVSQTVQNQPHTFLNITIDKQRFLRQSWNMSIDSKLLDQLNQDNSKTSTFFTSQEHVFQYFEQRHPTLVLHLYQRLMETDDSKSNNLKEFFANS